MYSYIVHKGASQPTTALNQNNQVKGGGPYIQEHGTLLYDFIMVSASPSYAHHRHLRRRFVDRTHVPFIVWGCSVEQTHSHAHTTTPKSLMQGAQCTLPQRALRTGIVVEVVLRVDAIA